MITTSGRHITGIVVPDGQDEMIVLKSDGNKVPVKQSQIDEIIPSKISAMSENLLNALTLQEITDLFAYLNTAPKSSVATRPAREVPLKGFQ